MKLVAAIALAAATILALPSSVAAWTFTWRDPNGVPYVENGKLDQPCKAIQHARGMALDWDRPRLSVGSRCCVRLFANAQCAGRPRGSSCGDWKAVAKADIAAYEVMRCRG
jgi:hypothetical protein